MSTDRVSILVVIPAFNESQVIVDTLDKVFEVLAAFGNRIEAGILVVDDGSSDLTAQCVSDYATANSAKGVFLVSLSRNFGHQAALLAGIEYFLENSVAHAMVTMDADQQDPPEILYDMVSQYLDGNDLVRAVRRSRSQDSFPKRTLAKIHYKLFQTLVDFPLVSQAADYTLMARPIAKVFLPIAVKTGMPRGLIDWMGFKGAQVEFDRPARAAGNAKYNFSRSLGLALLSYFSLSDKPLKLIGILSGYFAVLAIFMAGWVVFSAIQESTIPGWASTVALVLGLSAIQLLGLGIVGWYLAIAVRGLSLRPPYIIGSPSALSSAVKHPPPDLR
jgi:dolichol-phosphate mannosyltransferase